MADTPIIPDALPPTPSAFDGAMEQARVELGAMREAASQADAVVGGDYAGYSLHEVEEIGRYAIPYQAGWQALLAVIHDPAASIYFSPGQYPLFDGAIIQAAAQSVAAATSLPGSLHANLAALRNFLMQSYYANTPEGMTAEKAPQALREIAAYLGDGLAAGGRSEQAGADPSQPWLDSEMAAAGDGVGAQYLYEKILAMNRQSNWTRPFAEYTDLFGGATAWRLPPASATPFRPLSEAEQALLAMGDQPTAEEIDAAICQLDMLESEQMQREQTMLLQANADDLAALGEHLLHTADSLQDIAQMSEPVRQDAVEIAREILRKLKMLIGTRDVEKGLQIASGDEVDDVGELKGVAKIFERLLAWGRGIDATIMQHPSIVAATMAVGQLGYLAKMEAIRLAQRAGDLARAHQLQGGLKNTASAFTDTSHPDFAALLDTVERGIDTVLNRVQEINGPGAAVGHSPTKELGNSMAGTPIAGNALQVSGDGSNSRDMAGKQRAALEENMARANRAQAQRVTQQLANQQRNAGGGQSVAPARGSASAQLAALRQRLAQARRHASTPQVPPGVRNNAVRAAQIAGLHPTDDLHHGHGHPPDPVAATVAKIDPRLLNNIKQMNAMTAGLTTNPVLTGRAAFDKMKNANTFGVKAAPAKPVAAMTEEEKKKHDQLMAPPPPPKDKGGRGH